MSEQFYQVGGSLPANAPSYIKREADNQLYNYLKEGKYCYVLNARQVGKSSLRVHTSKRLEEEEYICINIDLTSIGSKDITADEWYFSLALQIIEELKIDEDEFAEWWDENNKLTVVNRFAKTFDRFILKENNNNKNIIIFIDEIDSILGIKRDFSADDFFAVIRTFYNLRSEDKRYANISFVLFGVATPEDLMQDATRTPFNIAHNIQIRQLKFNESLSLTDGLINQKVNNHDILTKIFQWTSGTPYLTQKLLDYIVMNPIESLLEIDDIVEKLFIHEGMKEINISNIQKRIVMNKDFNVKMLYLIDEILKNDFVLADDNNLEQIYLKLSGLVKQEDWKILYTNAIYKKVFNQSWLNEMIDKVDRPLSKDLQRWLDLNKTESALLKGEVLEKVFTWTLNRDDLSSIENEYLRLSIKANQQDILDDEKKSNQEKTIKYLRLFLIILFSFILGIVYFYVEAREKTHIAELQKQTLTEQKFLVEQGLKEARKQEEIAKDRLKEIEQYQKKEEYSSQRIDILLKKFEQDINHDETFDKYEIPKSMDSKVYLDNNIVDRFSIDVSIKENSALIQLISFTKRMNFNLKQYWIAILSDMSNIQKERLFKILQYDAYCDEGDSYSVKLNYEKAIQSYRKAIQINSKKDKAYFHLGVAYNKLERYNDIIKLFEEKSSHPDDKMFHLAGVAYNESGQYEKAIKYSLEALNLNPKNDKAYYNIGEAYYRLENYEGAISQYLKAIEVNPNNDKAYNNLGFTYFQLRDYRKAIEYCKKATLINPKHFRAYNTLGVSYFRLKEYDNALKAFTESVDINPEHHKATFNLFELQLIIGDDFNQEVEKVYSKLFKNKKNLFIKYEMLKILQDIRKGKKGNIDRWEQKYSEIRLSWSFTKLDNWSKSITNPKIQTKVKKALKAFKGHNSKIRK